MKTYGYFQLKVKIWANAFGIQLCAGSDTWNPNGSFDKPTWSIQRCSQWMSLTELSIDAATATQGRLKKINNGRWFFVVFRSTAQALQTSATWEAGIYKKVVKSVGLKSQRSTFQLGTLPMLSFLMKDESNLVARTMNPSRSCWETYFENMGRWGEEPQFTREDVMSNVFNRWRVDIWVWQYLEVSKALYLQVWNH